MPQLLLKNMKISLPLFLPDKIHKLQVKDGKFFPLKEMKWFHKSGTQVFKMDCNSKQLFPKGETFFQTYYAHVLECHTQ